MDSNDGRVPLAPGSRKPSPEGLGPSGFDPSRKPSNDSRSWTKKDDWLVCACGGFAFNVMKRDGLCHVLCAKCETDYTANVWEPQP